MPTITANVSENIKENIEERAEALNKSVSQIVREELKTADDKKLRLEIELEECNKEIERTKKQLEELR